jgi:membrane protease YdiL (CAAX protease family)
VYLFTWLVVQGAFALRSFEAAMVVPYGLERWPVLGTFGVALPLLFTITVIGTMVWTVGEELGWRGFLFPRLQEQFGFNGACLISGGIWAVWHYPGLLWADYNAGTNPAFAIRLLHGDGRGDGLYYGLPESVLAEYLALRTSPCNTQYFCSGAIRCPDGSSGRGEIHHH